MRRFVKRSSDRCIFGKDFSLSGEVRKRANKPVSYTHLDVYKRQLQKFPALSSQIRSFIVPPNSSVLHTHALISVSALLARFSIILTPEILTLSTTRSKLISTGLPSLLSTDVYKRQVMFTLRGGLRKSGK